MAQVGWVFIDDNGNKHRVGLYHGDRTGHLVIHCDGRVVQIDFLVKESRTYSFFIEDELCEVQLVREPDSRFSYGFNINKTVDTPRNRERKVTDRRNLRHLLLFSGVVVVFLALVVVGLTWWDGQQHPPYNTPPALESNLNAENLRLLNLEGRRSTARLYIVSESLGRKIYYAFNTHDSLQVTGYFGIPDTGSVMLPNGFPVTGTDEFSVTYRPDAPDVHRIDFYNPSLTTVNRYLNLASQIEQKKHPEVSPNYIQCLTDAALHLRGWQSLADFIYQSIPASENALHNTNSYNRLKRDPEFIEELKLHCWDK